MYASTRSGAKQEKTVVMAVGNYMLVNFLRLVFRVRAARAREADVPQDPSWHTSQVPKRAGRPLYRVSESACSQLTKLHICLVSTLDSWALAS